MIIFKGSFHSSTKVLSLVNVSATLASSDDEALVGLMSGDRPQDEARSCLPSDASLSRFPPSPTSQPDELKSHFIPPCTSIS